jgi:hypothetical protein
MRIVVTGLVAVLAAGCGVFDDTPRYHEDVAPILNARCAGCHQAGSIGPSDLTNYANAKAKANDIRTAVVSRRMPPWMPGEGNTFRHERRLTDEEIEKIRAWSENGTPEGDPAAAPPPLESDIDTITPDMEVKMKAPYQPDITEPDDYRCFVLDPKLTAPVAVTGFDIRPGDRRIVHHVIVFSVDKRHRGEADALDAQDATEGYTCFGDARVDSSMVGAWVPGTTATKFPYGTGVKLEEGSVLVIQVHYNTLEVREALDQTTALLETAPAYNTTEAYLFPIGDDDFVVPPGEVKKITRTFDTRDFELPPELRLMIHGVAPHMHLHGKSLRVYATTPEGKEIQLVDVPKWNFQWQQLFFYEEPIELKVGDKVTIECEWDNRPQAQPIVNGTRVEPTELRWGEGTLEEMCLNFFYATIK